MLVCVLGGCASGPLIAPRPAGPQLGVESESDALRSDRIAFTQPPMALWTDEARSVISVRRQPEAGGASWTVRRERRGGAISGGAAGGGGAGGVGGGAGGGGGVPISEDTLRREPSGDVVLVQTVQHDDAVITRFDPPLVVLPGSLRPGEPYTQRLGVTVHPINDPQSVQRRGSAVSTVTLEALQEMTTLRGSLLAARVGSTLRIELAPAQVQTATTDWYLLDDGAAGPIRQARRERVTVLGFVSRDVSFVRTLTDPPLVPLVPDPSAAQPAGGAGAEQSP
ncbi:MAG: hypothetical protein C0475_06265 [Planctomyces sp.]|nr:hypothetical protein [Planctomyces sp.]